MTARAAALAAYFDLAASLFDTAVARAGRGPDRRLRIGGHVAALNFAGQALTPKVLPALAHLPADTTDAAPLTIRLWDGASTGIALPPPPWEAVDFHERGNTRAYDDERFTLNFDRPTDVFVGVDAERRLGLFWTRDAATLPNFDTAAPLRRLWQGWFRHFGLFVVHAAAIGREGAGLLLAGRGGSGKSTTAVRSLAFALQYAGDDFCLVQGEPTPFVHSLFNAAKLNADALARMPALRPFVSNHDRLDREKAMIFVQQSAPAQVSLGFPLRAIVLPRVSGRVETVVSPASPLAAYRAVGPDTVFRTLGDARGMLAMLKTLVHHLPCYELALGTDDQSIRAALDGILQR